MEAFKQIKKIVIIFDDGSVHVTDPARTQLLDYDTGDLMTDWTFTREDEPDEKEL